MGPARPLPLGIAALLLGAAQACVQPLAKRPRQDPEPAVTDAEGGPAWAFGASAYAYSVPEGEDYLQPTVTADRDGLHLEARYNYESLDTASLWAGFNLGGGEEVAWELTPMLGAVAGDVDGIAPGYRGSVGWWRLELYSEGEYLRDVHDVSDSYFYTWSELTITPVDWLRLGLVAQRTRAYETDLDTQRGLLAGITCERFDFTLHVFNPDESHPTVVLGVALRF